MMGHDVTCTRGLKAGSDIKMFLPERKIDPLTDAAVRLAGFSQDRTSPALPVVSSLSRSVPMSERSGSITLSWEEGCIPAPELELPIMD
jgi:hypothetical protein